jgi:PII-like signaling protein
MSPRFVERNSAHRGKRLTIYVNHHDRVARKSVFFEVLKGARKAKLGVTVFQGRLGYGAEGRLHRAHLLSEDSTQAIVIVGLPERIDAFLVDIASLIGDVFVAIDHVEIVDT